MKYISFLVLLVLVASCGPKQTEKIKDTDHSMNPAVIEEVNNLEATQDVELVTNTEAVPEWAIDVNSNTEPANTPSDDSENNVIENSEKNKPQEEEQFIENTNVADPEEANKWIKLESDPVEDNGVVVEEEEKVNDVTQETVSNLDSAVTEISENAWSELIEVKGDYTNPKGAVDMVISYKLDSEGKITEINTAATTYDLSQFNTKVTDVVWKTVKEASETYFSGSSLTTEAFQKAMKAQIK